MASQFLALTWILPPIEEAQNEFLLWLLAVGGISAVKMGERGMSYKMPEHHWFVGHLVFLGSEYQQLESGSTLLR